MNSIEFCLLKPDMVVFEHSRVVIRTLVSGSTFIYNYHCFVIMPMKSILWELL